MFSVRHGVIFTDRHGGLERCLAGVVFYSECAYANPADQKDVFARAFHRGGGVAYAHLDQHIHLSQPGSGEIRGIAFS